MNNNQSQNRHNKKYIFIVSLLFICILVITFLPNLYFHINSDKINVVNNTLNILNRNKINTDSLSSYSEANIIKKYINLYKTHQEIRNYDEYHLQLQEKKKIFGMQLKNMASEMKEFETVDTSFLDDYDFENMSDEDIKFQKRYVLEIKNKFKEEVEKTNLFYEKSVEDEIGKMTLEEKIGQLFIFSLSSPQLTNNEASFLKKNNIGGVILFSKNISNPNQLNKLTDNIQNSNNKYPLFIATDQEGGVVKRIKWDQTLDHKSIAKLNQQNQCDQWKSRSKTLNDSGINLNFGIIADYTKNTSSYIYNRTFSSNLETTINSVETAVNCHTESLAAVKHYPGHGGTDVDTHKTLGEMIYKSEEQWKESTSKPFEAIVDSSDMFMIGHLISEWIDPENPASISKKNISYLREDFGFKGLTITDDLNMLKAVGISNKDAVTKSFIAGNDILLLNSSNIAKNQDLVSTIKTMVEENPELEIQLNDSVRKILQAKNKIITNQQNYIPSNLVY